MCARLICARLIKPSVMQSFYPPTLFYCFNYKSTTRQLNKENRSNFFYNDLINLLNFEASDLKLDKKTWKDIDINSLGYVDKKPDWNVNSVNPLYLITNRVYGSISEKNGAKYLTINKGDSVLQNYDQVLSGIKYHIDKIKRKRLILTPNVTVNLKSCL